MTIDEQSIFPRHDIDPKLKDKDWCLQAAKAIWGNYSRGMPPGSIFYAKRDRYSEIRDYAGNKQSIQKYKKLQTGEENPDTAFFNIDQSTEAIVKTHRQKILGRLKKIAYNITATPIDPMSKGKLDDYYSKKKVKIMMREALAQSNSKLTKNPLIAKEAGEADDIEELEMQMQFSPKFIRAKEAEQGIAMIFYENDMDELTDLWDEDLTDFGVAVVKEGIDMNNRVYFEYIHPGAFGCSHSETGNFNKLSNAWHVKQVPLSELASLFKDEDLEVISRLTKGKNGNPANPIANSNTGITRGWDAFMATVMEFEILSYNITAVEERKNKLGNLKVGLTDPANIDKALGPNKKVTGSTYEVIYKGKWIVGSNYIYDYGLATNTKRSRDKKKLGRTNLSYHPVAASFDKMSAKGVTEDLIPIADEIHMVTLKMRNLNNRMIINGLSIDFSALENVALGGAGAKALTPEENLDMLFQIGIIGFRGDLISQEGKNQRKAVEPLIIDYVNQFTALANYKQQLTNSMFDISGLNQTSDSATVNPKMLVGIANAQNAGTNNALYFIENARRKLIEKCAKNGIQRLQAAVLIGPYEGYAQTLGKSTLEFYKFEEENLPYDYDMIIEDKPSEEQKQILQTALMQDVAQQLLDTSDIFTITNDFNIKDAQMILAYKVKKNKELQQQNALANTQNTANSQIQSAQAAENEKRQTLILEDQLERGRIDQQGEWNYKIAELKVNAASGQALGEQITKLLQTGIIEHNKSMIANPGQPMGNLDPSQLQQPDGQQQQPQPSQM